MFRHPSLCFLTWNLAYSLDTLTSKKAWQEALWKYPYQTPVPSWPLAQHPPTAIILSPDFWVHHRKGREDNCHLQTSFQTLWYHPRSRKSLQDPSGHWCHWQQWWGRSFVSAKSLTRCLLLWKYPLILWWIIEVMTSTKASSRSLKCEQNGDNLHFMTKTHPFHVT